LRIGDFFDKNSLWNELNIEKRELYVKKKKSQDMRVLSKLCPSSSVGVSFAVTAVLQPPGEPDRQNLHFPICAHPKLSERKSKGGGSSETFCYHFNKNRAFSQYDFRYRFNLFISEIIRNFNAPL
jgi:hypothetical protein